MPTTWPAVDELNFTPTSTGFESLVPGLVGTALLAKSVCVSPDALVVKFHTAGAAIEWPRVSSASTVAVKAVPAARLADGVKVAVLLAAS